MLDHLSAPRIPVNALQLPELVARHVEAVPVHVIVVTPPANGELLALCPAADPVDDPGKDSHVFAESRPEKSSVLVLPEPVDVEDARRGAQLPLHFNPVTKIVAHV